MVCSDTPRSSELSGCPRLPRLLATVSIILAHFQFVESACGPGAVTNVQALKTRQTITSPNYPGFYLNNMACKWVLTAEQEDEVVMFTMLELYTRDSGHCGQDYVQIQDGPASWSPSMYKYCGVMEEGEEFEDLISTDNAITVTFKTDRKYTHKGFMFTFWTVPKAEVMYEEMTWGPENYLLLGCFGLILSSIIFSMVLIAVIHNTPALYNKFLRGGVPPTKPLGHAHGTSGKEMRAESDETLCYSSRTVLESTSTLTSPI